MYYKTASIILNSEQKSSTSSDILIAQVDAQKEKLAGKLFILIEVSSNRSEALKVVNFLINNISYNYYQNEKILLREKIESLKTESIFQDSLAKTNRDLIEFLSKEKIKISPYAFNITAAVIHDDELHFSTVGKNHTMMIYKEKTGVIRRKKGKTFEPETVEYQIAEIGSSGDKRTETININKLFSDITSGKLPSNGFFVVINEALSEYISNKQLLKIVTKLSPAGAAEQIKNILSQVNAYTSFLGIIIKNSTINELSQEDIKKEMQEQSRKYLNEINALEQKTDEIMAPAGVINLKKISRSFAKKPTEKIPKKEEEKVKTKKPFFLKDRVFFKKRENAIKNAVFSSIKTIGTSFAWIFKSFGAILNKKNAQGLLNGFAAIFKKEEAGGIKRSSKVILAISSFLLVALFANLSIINQRNKEELIEQEFEESISEIERIQNKIDASLLYNNENDARSMIEDTKKKISSIPEEKMSNENVLSLVKKQEEQVKRLMHDKEVKNMKQLADFSVLDSEASAQNIILKNDTIFLGDSKRKTIYKIDLKEDINTANNSLPEEINNLEFPTINGEALNYLNTSAIISVKKDGRKENIDNQTIEIPDDQITSMGSFNGNIYLLGKKQIYRYSKSSNGWIGPKDWLESNIDLSDATGISIDGYIYVLYKNGSVKKLLRGAEENFKIDQLYLPIENADKIISSDKYDFIYILESSKKRLVVFTKEGKFLLQYSFPEIDVIKDMEINESARKIYILGNNIVYEGDATHINS